MSFFRTHPASFLGALPPKGRVKSFKQACGQRKPLFVLPFGEDLCEAKNERSKEVGLLGTPNTHGTILSKQNGAARLCVSAPGKLAQQANGSVLLSNGDTIILATATMSKEPKSNLDFFPLTCDYEERKYAVGKIPGGFVKRGGRPGEKATLTSRLIDRPLRPLFPLWDAERNAGDRHAAVVPAGVFA